MDPNEEDAESLVLLLLFPNDDEFELLLPPDPKVLPFELSLFAVENEPGVGPPNEDEDEGEESAFTPLREAREEIWLARSSREGVDPPDPKDDAEESPKEGEFPLKLDPPLPNAGVLPLNPPPLSVEAGVLPEKELFPEKLELPLAAESFPPLAGVFPTNPPSSAPPPPPPKDDPLPKEESLPPVLVEFPDPLPDRPSS